MIIERNSNTDVIHYHPQVIADVLQKNKNKKINWTLKYKESKIEAALIASRFQYK